MATSSSTTQAGPSARPRRRLPLVVALVVVAGLAGAAAWFFLLREPGPAPEPEAGEVLTVDPVSINLAEGSYLRLGLALQLTEEATAEEPDPSKALDLAVATFTGRTVQELSEPTTRAAIQDDLTTKVVEAYHEEVMDIYYTEFVTQ